MIKKLMEPIKINGMELSNRMMVSAMVTGYVNADGTASEKYIAYHEAKARGGWGLIITEDYIISPTAGASAPEIRIDGIDTVVIAIGVSSNKALEEALRDRYQGEMIVVGDALKAKNGYLGIQEGFMAGLKI